MQTFLISTRWTRIRSFLNSTTESQRQVLSPGTLNRSHHQKIHSKCYLENRQYPVLSTKLSSVVTSSRRNKFARKTRLDTDAASEKGPCHWHLFICWIVFQFFNKTLCYFVKTWKGWNANTPGRRQYAVVWTPLPYKVIFNGMGRPCTVSCQGCNFTITMIARQYASILSTSSWLSTWMHVSLATHDKLSSTDTLNMSSLRELWCQHTLSHNDTLRIYKKAGNATTLVQH